MAKKAEYKFSPNQCLHLNAVIPQFIAALKAKDTNQCSKTVQDVAAIICEEAAIVDEATKKKVAEASVTNVNIILILMNQLQSANIYLVIKADKEKRSWKAAKPVTKTGLQLFHDEMWETQIKPLALEIVNSDKPNMTTGWLNAVRAADKQAWDLLGPDEQREWNAKATALNGGTAAKEAKAK